MLGRKKETKNEEIKFVELTEVTDGKAITDLRKVMSTRHCEVFEVNKDTYFTLLNEKLRGNLQDIEHAANSYGFGRQVLKVKNVVADKGIPVGYSTDSYDMTLGEYFISRDPDVYTTRIILQSLKNKIISLPGHGDLSLDSIVLKDGKIFITNRFLQENTPQEEFEYLGSIEKEFLSLYGYPQEKGFLPVDEADTAIYNYLHYLLINTSGEERKQLINAGLESCYKTLFVDVTNRNIEFEEDSYYYGVKSITRDMN
ncbi:MAG: hypothetical protein K2G03_07160, partial [Bacilli bacterium]|nr:hypothetical protein [Bacilli bacterium]